MTWPVTVLHNGATLRGKTGNVSRGGALLYLQEKLEQGDNVRIALEIPDCRDVITAEGEVIRAFSLKRGSEQQSSFAFAVRFQNVSENDLRFFCGNLAPEWKDGLSEDPDDEPGSAQLARGFWQYGVFAIAVLIVSLLFYFMLSRDNSEVADIRQFEQLDERLRAIEMQLDSFASSRAEITQIDEKIDIITNDFLKIKERLASAEPRETPTQKAAISEAGATDIPGTNKAGVEQPTSLATKHKTGPAEKSYHIVKKGENLYRIGLAYNLSVEELKTLNNLSPGSEIFPGQRLLIK